MTNLPRLFKLTAGLAALAVSGHVLANSCPPGNPPTNCGPPGGAPVLLDLDGTPVPHSYTEYQTSFVATDTTTVLSFAFREDPAFLELDNVSLTTGGGANLVQNPGFESGLTGWTALNQFGATFAGTVDPGCGVGSSACWFDGSVQGYDGLTQSISTVVGDTYALSFELNDNGSLSTFSSLSTNGDTTSTSGNGIDLVVYGGNSVPVEGAPPVGTPSSAPEIDPASAMSALTLLLGGLTVLRGRKSKA